jgi:NADH-quinone oxidoreductase subunit M
MPVFSALFVLFAMANAGLPATSGFVGEFLVIMGAMKVNFWYAAVAATTLVFGAAYTLWLVKRVVFGPIVHPQVAQMPDVSPREFLVLALVALAVLGMGIYPAPFTAVMHASVEQLLAHVAESKCGAFCAW